jgi:hypothetical protein
VALPPARLGEHGYALAVELGPAGAEGASGE